MRPFNKPNLIPVNTVMSGAIDSTPLQLWNVFLYSIQVFFTGTPTGSFKLQASNDPAAQALATGNITSPITAPTHWSDVEDSTFTVVAAGDVMWTVENPGYNWVRVVYTDNSSGTSTATITSSTANGKGF